MILLWTVLQMLPILLLSCSKRMCLRPGRDPQREAFVALKDLVSTPPCLLMHDLDKPFVVHVDASGFAVGAVLQQDQGKGLQPVAFESRKLQPPERKLAPYDRELLALVHALC
eukprot:jgi/Botrbrau1/20757/Bobra.0900s0002.1